MSDYPDEESLFKKLESDLATNEQVALLSEWASTNTLKVVALNSVLGNWRQMMITSGYSPEAIDDVLPQMIERLWPAPMQRIGFESGD